MFDGIDTFVVLTFLVRLELPVQGLETSRSIAWCVGIEHPSIKECITAIGPETSYPNVGTSISSCYSELRTYYSVL